MFLLILLPLSLPGWFVNTPLILLGRVFNSLTPYPESKATHTMGAIVLFAPIVYFVVALILYFFLGVPLSLSPIILPIVGLVCCFSSNFLFLLFFFYFFIFWLFDFL
jgi:hypothetical protein